jgi:transcriptional regulator with XRE-family HTH domain
VADLDKNKILKQIGIRIKKIRLIQNLSRYQLAFELKTSEKLLRQIENAEINTSVFKLFQIADALDVKPEDLINLSAGSKNNDLGAVIIPKKNSKKKPSPKESTKKKQ